MKSKQPPIQTDANIFAKARSNTKRWRALRMEGLGGSDAGKICGLSKWGSPLSVWLEKTGQSTGESTINEYAEWGLRLEDPIAKKFQQNHRDLNVRKTDYIFQAAGNEDAFMLANPDRLITDSDGSITSFVEIKTAIEYKLSDFDNDDMDRVPDDYMMQLHHYMYVLNVDHCHFVYLIGGHRYGEKVIHRDEELIELMLEKERAFWKMVVNGEQPLPSWNDNSAIASMFPVESAEDTIDAPVELDEKLIEERERVKENAAILTKKEKELSNLIRLKMGYHNNGYAGPYRITYRLAKSGSRTLRIKRQEVKEKSA